MLRNKDTVLMFYYLICNPVLTLSLKTVKLSTENVNKPMKCWHPEMYIVHEFTLQDVHINIMIVIIVDSKEPL